MSTGLERRMERLQSKLKGRCRTDGSPKPGFEQNVATIHAEMAQLSERIAKTEDNEYE